jgi:CheY-like chemotaxis protein
MGYAFGHPAFDPSPAQPGPGCGAPGGGRLNLLLSQPTWAVERWADMLPRLLEPMGIASIQAGSARAAERVIRTQQIHIAVVDLSLPLDEGDPTTSEEAGTRVLELLARLDQPPPTVVVKRHRSQRDQQAHLNAALRCGAFAVVDQTAANLETMLGVMQRCLTKFYDNRWPSV